MALTITIQGVDRTNHVDIWSLRIEEEATDGLVGVCRFDYINPSAITDIAAGHSVVITAPSTTLFGGEVVEVTAIPDGLSRHFQVVAHDYNILLEETVVPSQSYSAGQADSAIIADLFSTYRSDIDAVTYVSTLDASMVSFDWQGMTLREILDDICSYTGGRYYVDYDKYLHYFASETNPAGFYLSTEPDFANSFPYGDFQEQESLGQLANKIYVLGDGVSGWVQDSSSIAVYGERHAVSRDMRISTAAGVEKRGNALLDRYAWPRTTYRCWTEEDGLRAGMSIRLVNSVYSIDDTFYIRKLTMEPRAGDGSVRRYHLELNDEPPPLTVGARAIELYVNGIFQTVNEICQGEYDTDAPATPTITTANLTTGVETDVDGGQHVWLQVTWGSVSDADLDHYEVQISTSSDFSGYTITRNHPGGGDRLERFMPVVGATVYYVRVRAVDWWGNASAWSSTVSKTTASDTEAPAQVTGLSASASRTLVGLAWTANTEADLLEYEVQRAPDSGGSPGAWSDLAVARLNYYIDQDFTDSEIAAEGTWWYRVRAVDTSGNAGAWSANASATLSRINADHIAAATITGDKVAANTITADKLNVAQLSAISADLGTITAGTVTGATVRTAASGARIVLDSTNGIQAYNSSGTQTVSILPSGAGWIGASDKLAWNTAGSLTIDGSVLVAGTVVASAISNTINQPLFNVLDGLLLLGPNCLIDTSRWRSARGQEAALSNCLQLVAGRWPNTQALVNEDTTENYIVNPIFEVNVTDGWTLSGTGASRTRDTSIRLFGSASCRLDCGSGYSATMTSAAMSLAAGESVTASLWIYRTGSYSVRMVIYDQTNATARKTVYASHVGRWEFIYGSWTNDTGSTVDVQLRVVNASGDPSQPAWFDGCQMEKAGYYTRLAHGDMGYGYQWSGTPHNSNTVRNASLVSLDGLVSLISGRSAWSVRMVCQAPYAYNGRFPVTTPVFWDARGSSDSERVMVAYHNSTAIKLYINGAYRCEVAGSFSAYDWLDIVATLDFTNDVYRLYVNGVMVDEDTTALSAPALTYWKVGASYAHTARMGLAIAEYAVFGRALTADEVAALYLRDTPLIDCGAVEKPGIYLYDGQFRLASSSTGARLEMDSESFRAYSSSAQTISLDSQGNAFFGSDLSTASGTALCVFASAQTYNGESMAAGSVLFGDNSSGKANMLWDPTSGILRFRGGTTTQCYIATDGSLMAGGGYIKISAAANILFSVYSKDQGLAFFSDTGFATNVGYIRVMTSTYTYRMNLSTGGDDVPSWSDFQIQTRSQLGTTRTPFYIKAADKQVYIYGATGATLAVRNDGDGNWPAFYAQQVSNSRAVAHFDQDAANTPVIRLDGPTGTPSGGIQGYILVNINGTDRYFAYY